MRLNTTLLMSTVLTASVFAGLTGCASAPPTAGDLMKSYAVDSQARVDLREKLAKDWQNGQDLVNDGQKQLKKGQDLAKKAEDAQKMINEANDKIAKGNALMSESTAQFEQNFPKQSLATPAK